MADRNLEVSLSFTADTKRAQQEMEKLQEQLNRLGTTTGSSGGRELPIEKSLIEAQSAAQKLGLALKNATNVNTGKLSLSQFAQELEKSKMSLADYRTQLSAFGAEGERAFLNVAQQISTADAALVTSNGLVNKLWTSLKNVAGWQLSTRIFNTFVGSFQEAFDYAQDLNASLNNIQIVTGNSADQMAKFAKQANVAAKELSTTTTAYTDAALIYYQQGLGDSEVKARTDLTIKAANAAGTSTEDMSDYLTAVWNSYKVGTSELEKYVDVMAALGAGTATSLEEISSAMEKVASVGEATGVSFEQLSSIIATVSSTTRQSAETVGTAFKTIFARMADLKVNGYTEEDGITTTLGTVSSQLAAVGINVLDANGNLRDMGNVMEELMSKWGTMNEAAQQAVAIAVAGKRQYTDLLALMNNQDLYQQSMDMALNSEGTTEEQAERYANSWAAAQKRVKAAAQGIYDSLISDDFFIKMNDALADTLGLIEKVIDSFGGFSGVLGALGTLVLKVFDKQINAALNKTVSNMYYNSTVGRQQVEMLREEANKQATIAISDRAASPDLLTTAEKTQLDISKQRLELQERLRILSKGMSEDEIKLAQQALDTNDAFGKRAIELAEIQTELEQIVRTQTEEAKDNIANRVYNNPRYTVKEADNIVASRQAKLDKLNNDYINQTGEFDPLRFQYTNQMSHVHASGNNITYDGLLDNLKQVQSNLTGTDGSTNWATDRVQKYIDVVDKANQEIETVRPQIKQLETEQEQLNLEIENYEKLLNSPDGQNAGAGWIIDTRKKINDLTATYESNAQKMTELSAQDQKAVDAITKAEADISKDASKAKNAEQRYTELARSLGVTKDVAQKLAKTCPDLTKAMANARTGTENFQESLNNLNLSLSRGKTFTQIFAESITGVLRTVSSFAMGISSLTSAFNTLKNTDMSTFEKFSSIMMSLSFGIPALMSGLSGLKTTISGVAASFSGLVEAASASYAITAAETSVKETFTQAELAAEAATAAEIVTEEAAAALKAEKVAIEQLSTKEKWLYILAQKAGIEMSAAEIIADRSVAEGEKSVVASKIAETATNGGLSVSQRVLAAATALVNGQLKEFLLLILPIAAVIAAVAASVYVLVKAFQAWHDAQPEVQLEKMTEEAEAAKERFDELTSQVEELKSSLDSLNESYETIASLKEGTEEWTQAVIAANREVLELIDTYKVLQDHPEWVTLGANGIITLTPEGQEGVYNQAVATQTAGYDWYLQKDLAKQKQEVEVLEDQLFGRWDLSPYQHIAAYYPKGTDATDYDDQTSELDVFFNNLIAGYQKEGDKIFSQELKTKYGGRPWLEQFLLTNYPELRLYGDESVINDIAEAVRGQKDLIISAANLKDSTDKLAASNDSLLVSNVAAQKGSILTENDISKYFDGQTYDDVRQSEREKAAETTGHWNYSDNYHKGDEEWELIEKILPIFGEDAKYTAQRKGSMIITANGKEIPLTEDQFYDAVASVSTPESYGDTITDAIQQSLETFEIDDSALTDSAKTTVSNVVTALIHNVEDGIEGEVDADTVKNQAQANWNKLLEEYKTAFGENEGFNQIIKDFQNLDFSNPTFESALDNYYAGRIELEKLRDVLKEIEGSTSLEALAEQIADLEKELGLSNNELYNYTKYIMEIAEESEAFADSLATDAEAALDVATKIEKMNLAIDTLADNYDDWADVLKDSSPVPSEAAQAYEGLRQALVDLLQISEDSISYKFIKDNLDLIKQAATGSETAIESLRDKLSEEIKIDIIARYPDNEEISQKFEEIETLVNNLPDLEVGATISVNDDESVAAFVQSLNNLVDQTGMSADQMNTYLAGIGYEPQYEVADLETPMESPNTETYTTLEGTGETNHSQVKIDVPFLGEIEFGLPEFKYTTTSKDLGPTEADGGMSLVSFSGSGKAPHISGVKRTIPASYNNYSSSNAGGKSPGSSKSSSSKSPSSSSSKPQKTETQKTDVDDLESAITRFKNSDNALESLSRTMTKLSNKKSQLWGKSYLEAIDEENELLARQAELYQWQADEAQAYRASDLDSLRALGYDPIVDENGYLTNYEQIQAAIQQGRIDTAAAYDAAVNAENSSYDDAVNSLGDDSNDEKYSLEDAHDTVIDGLEEEYEALTKNYDDAEGYLESYEEATEKYYDATEALEENLATQRENNYDRIITEMNLALEVSERTRDILEAIRSDFRDGLYGINDSLQNDMAQIVTYGTQTMTALEKAKADLDEKYASGAIDENQYQEGLLDIAQQALDAKSAIEQLEDEIKNGFIDALNEASDIIDNDLDKFDHLHTVVESVINLVKLTSGEDSYKVLGDWYQQQADTSLAQLQSLQAYYTELQAQRQSVQDSLNAAKASGNQQDIDKFQKDLDEIENLARDTEEELLSQGETYVDDLINIFTNSINEALSEMEDAMTGGSTFDTLDTQLGFAADTADDYLTEVNQQYETQKLIRTALNDLEKTSNTAAKNRLQLFIEETEELQNQSELSEYELGIQQKKYDILLAEIALEEAQNNKSQVRLQRDSEGNYNYVYTADEDTISEAEQEYEDAQNALYNYVLETTESLQEAIISNREEFKEALADITSDSSLSQEEMLEKADELYELYLNRELELVEQANIGMEACSQAYTDAYTNDIMDQIGSTDDFEDAYEDMRDAMIDATDDLADGVDNVTTLMDDDFLKTEGNLQNYTEGMNKDLESVGNELTAIQATTQVWSQTMSTYVDMVAASFLGLANDITEVVNILSGFDIDFSQLWANGTGSVEEALAILQARQYAVDNNINNKGQYEDNEIAINDTWAKNMAAMIESASTEDEAIGYANSRIAKIMMYPEQFSGYETTAAVLQQKWAAEGWDTNNADYQYILKNYASYDTGGYTGEFGSNGRLAILHEKELVLNQNDTQNLLDTVDLVDKLLQSLEYQSLLQNLDVSSIGNQASNGSDTLEQEVTIHAEFPNVQDRNEIEAALSNIVNTASQYANRKI